MRTRVTRLGAIYSHCTTGTRSSCRETGRLRRVSSLSICDETIGRCNAASHLLLTVRRVSRLAGRLYGRAENEGGATTVARRVTSMRVVLRRLGVIFYGHTNISCRGTRGLRHLISEVSNYGS